MLKNENNILIEAGTNELEVLVFMLGGRRFGVNVAKVREVILPLAPAPAPGQPESVLGLIRLRGAVLMLVDLHRHLGIPQVERDAARTGTRVVVTEFNGITAAFEVESVDSIYRISWERIRAAPNMKADDVAEITGIAEIGEHMVMMLDFESVYADITGGATQTENDVVLPEGLDRSSVLVWLAEDSSFIRASIERILKHAGYTNYQMFNDGAAAWEAFKKAVNTGKRIPDALVSDIEMPRMDGLHLCKRVKSTPQTADTKVVLYSSLITEQTRHRGMEVGADEQFNKPKISQVIETLDGWSLEKRAGRTSPAAAAAA